jgi:hypothetical protein
MLARRSSLVVLVRLGHLPIDWKRAAKEASRLQKSLPPAFPQDQVQDKKGVITCPQITFHPFVRPTLSPQL